MKISLFLVFVFYTTDPQFQQFYRLFGTYLPAVSAKGGYLHLRLGNPEKALEEFGKAWDIAVDQEWLSSQRWVLYWKGLTYLQMKSVDEAQRVAVELREMIEKGIYKKSIRIYYLLMGLIEFEKDNIFKAVEYLEKAVRSLPYQDYSPGPHATFIYSLALAYYEAEDFDKALEEYERIVALTTGRLSYGDIYAKSFFMLGKIYEQQGNTAKAIENHEKFLSLWKDADPGIAEVEDAKKRLAGLQDN